MNFLKTVSGIDIHDFDLSEIKHRCNNFSFLSLLVSDRNYLIFSLGDAYNI